MLRNVSVRPPAGSAEVRGKVALSLGFLTVNDRSVRALECRSDASEPG